MPRLLCLAQAHAPAKRPRAKAAAAAKAAPRQSAFTMLERVPVRLAVHNGVWAAIRKQATRQPIVDTEHPEEAFAAHVVQLDQLGGEALQAIAGALAERRALMLDAEKHAPDSDVLARRLDRLFEQELEWLAIRNLLASALPRAPGRRRSKAGRVLLLIDA